MKHNKNIKHDAFKVEYLFGKKIKSNFIEINKIETKTINEFFWYRSILLFLINKYVDIFEYIILFNFGSDRIFVALTLQFDKIEFEKQKAVNFLFNFSNAP